MYKCQLCGIEFDEPAWKTERRLDLDGRHEEMAFQVCPCCGESYYDEIEEEEPEE